MNVHGDFLYMVLFPDFDDMQLMDYDYMQLWTMTMNPINTF